MMKHDGPGALAGATEADQNAAQQPDLSTKSEVKWPAPSSNQYAVIYADPPWPFKTYSAKGEGRGNLSLPMHVAEGTGGVPGAGFGSEGFRPSVMGRRSAATGHARSHQSVGL